MLLDTEKSISLALLFDYISHSVIILSIIVTIFFTVITIIIDYYINYP